MFNLLQICVFLSGGVALVLEAVYQKYLATLIGASTPSATIVLVTYFLGITLGSVVCPKKGGNPRLRLSFLELAIALWSLTLALLFYRSYDFLMDALADWSGSAISLAAMRWLIAMIWILPPTMAMGAHLPTLECFLETNGLGKSWQLTRLYALNTVGACFFTFITPFLFFQNLGLEGTLLLSAAIGLVVASLLFFGLKKFQTAVPASPLSEEDDSSPEKSKTPASLPTSASPHQTQTASSFGGTAAADSSSGSSAAPSAGAAEVTGSSDGAADISAPTSGADESDQFQPFRGRVPWPILLAFFSGLLIFSLEVVWNHLVSSVMGASTYSFSIILGVVLLSLAIASRRVERLPASGAENAVEAVTVALRQLTLAIPVTMLLWPWSGRLLAVIRTILNLESFWLGEFFKICIAFILIKPIAAAAGTLFPATFRVLNSGASPSGRDVGRLNVANTLGCVVGALTGNYLFIPAIGAQWTFILLWLVCLAAWRVLLRRRTISNSFAEAASSENNPQAPSQIQHQLASHQTAQSPQMDTPAIAAAETSASHISADAPDNSTVPGENSKTAPAADAPAAAQQTPAQERAPRWKIRLQRFGEPVLGTIIALAFIISGGWNMDEMLAGYGVFLNGQYYSSAKTVFLREDQYAGFVSVRQQDLDGVPTATLLQNGKFDANDTDQTFAQIGFGLIPSMFSRSLNRALVIGFGSGQTASVIYDTGYKEIDICEMSPGHIEAAKKYFSHLNKNVLDRENVHLWLEDGRNYMGRTRHRYDLISIEITSLFFSGSSDLYSREFYRQVSSHLTEYGIFQQWMQLHHLSIKELAVIMATAREVFPYVEVWDNVGQAIIIASNHPLEFQENRWKHFMESESLASEREHFIGVLGEGDSETFQKNRRFLTREQIDYILQKTPHVIHTDRNKWLEFHAPLYYLSGSELFEKNIQNLIELREESKKLQTPSK